MNTVSSLNRRSFLGLGAKSLALAAASSALADGRDWSGRDPVRYPDPDVIALDPRFAKYKVGSAAIQRLRGPAACGSRVAPGRAGARFLVWKRHSQQPPFMRRLDEDGHISEFRKPSNNCNGNTFDFEAVLSRASRTPGASFALSTMAN